MNVKPSNLIKIAVTLCCVLLLSTSCTKEYYTQEYYDNAITFSAHDIAKGDWKWNANKGRYEATVTFPELTANMYNDGVLNGSVFILENGEEIQTPIPYVQTWIDASDNVYTETLSFEVSYTKKTITYILQSSDLGRDDYYLPDYEIKLSFIYN